MLILTNKKAETVEKVTELNIYVLKSINIFKKS